MNTPLPRLLALCLILSAPAGAAMVERVSLAPALGMVESAPGFKVSVLNQVQLANSLIAAPSPTLAPMLSAAPTAADPWRAESAKLVGALIARPAAVAAHQQELRAALGDQGVDILLKASSRVQARAAEHPELAAQLAQLKGGMDVENAASVQEMGARLNALFENSRSRPEAPEAVAAGAASGSHKPVVGLARPGERPAMTEQELEAYVNERSITSPRGLRRVNFASGDYRPEYDAALRRMGVDVAVIKAPSRAELGKYKEDDGYHLKSEYERWVLTVRTPEEHEAMLDHKRARQFRKEMAASEHVPVKMAPLTVEDYERWYPIYEDEVVGKPGGKRNVGLDYARALEKKGDLQNWWGLFYYDPKDPTKVIGGCVYRASKERGMFIGGYAAYRPELKDARPSVRSFAEGVKKAKELGFTVFSFGQDTNFFGYDYSLGLMSNKANFNPTPYPEDEIVLMKVLDTSKIASVQNKLGQSGGYFFFGIKRDSPLVERYLQSKEAGAPKEAQELLGGLYFSPEIVPAEKTTVGWHFRGNDPNPIRTPAGIDVIEKPMAAPATTASN